MASADIRKIIHVDMDAFYASVEQRDNFKLKDMPIAVGYDGKRGVIATASYEARHYGVRSALPTSTAKRLCPQLIVIAPRFDTYRAVSKQVKAIFSDYTDLIEPVALDEAYLDVTKNKQGIPTAWKTALAIRGRIFKETGLTASAGVSYNKFLAKTASDIKKPNGQYLITPEMGNIFIRKLPIAKFHGIGPVTAEKMHKLGIHTGADLETWSSGALQERFGKLGIWYYHIAHGDDNRPVEPNRERKSVSAETTFIEDVFDKDQVEESIKSLANEIWLWADKTEMHGRTVTIKIKWSDFGQSTRSRTSKLQITDSSEFLEIAIDLVNLIFPVRKGIRLIGVGMSNFDPIVSTTPTQVALDV
ncbi:MAG TPA: DNA polymerase IV [Candidatus Saccharimonadales bacterium]|nr:DNA polymerase IV [Candidatus Saccharimonadales bacterium]